MQPWTASWIGFGHQPADDFGVFLFRCALKVDHVPSELLVRVSADQRYRLYVNDIQVSIGPQRGDETHWFYETIDLAPYLRPGKNRVWAVVWNFGWLAPNAQMSRQTGFVLDAGPQQSLTTPGDWQVARMPGWSCAHMHQDEVRECYLVGGTDALDGRLNPLWPTLYADDKLDWRSPREIRVARPRGETFEPGWSLVPRSIPPMRYDRRDPALQKELPHEPNTRLIDFQELLCAYPRFAFVGKAGAEVRITYAEALWGEDGKGNRNETHGKKIRGYQDRVVLGDGQTFFEPLWFRTFRYIQIEPADVELCSLEVFETGYPYQIESSFEADSPDVVPIWDVSVRTAMRCAGETYFDCPYYEQLQYVGDTRIQALISYYLGKDRALARNAIDQFSWSIGSNCLTQSRYPNSDPQFIPPFSLFWLSMIYDSMLYDHRELTEEGKVYAWWTEKKDGNSLCRVIKRGFHAVQKREKLGDPGWWNFMDWVPSWQHGVPPGGSNSTVCHLLLMIIERTTQHWNSVPIECWTDEKLLGLFEHAKRHLSFEDGLVRHDQDPDWRPSEHAEALYRLLQDLYGQPMDPWPYEALARAKAAETTFYFSYYKHLAMQPKDYMAELAPWKQMIEDGLTTFAENPEPTRSDCHAWSAHPILGFFQIVAGITSISPGWSRTRIAPNPGSLKRFHASVAHPDGELVVHYEGDRLKIESPVPFDVVWKGKLDSFAPGIVNIE